MCGAVAWIPPEPAQWSVHVMVFSLVVVAVSLAQVPAAGAAVAVIPPNPTPLVQRLEAKLAEALAAEGVPLQPVTALRPDDGRACYRYRRAHACI